MARGRKKLSIDIKIQRLEAQLELLRAEKTGLPIKSIPNVEVQPAVEDLISVTVEPIEPE